MGKYALQPLQVLGGFFIGGKMNRTDYLIAIAKKDEEQRQAQATINELSDHVGILQSRVTELEAQLKPGKELRTVIVEHLGNWTVCRERDGLLAELSARESAMKAEIERLNQPSEELKALFDSSLPTRHTNKKSQQVWTPDECKQVVRITELMKAVAARENAMKAERDELLDLAKMSCRLVTVASIQKAGNELIAKIEGGKHA